MCRLGLLLSSLNLRPSSLWRYTFCGLCKPWANVWKTWSAFYLLLIILISPHINPRQLSGGSTKAITGSLMVLITSFGFASIVPSLRDYFQDDIPTLRKAVFFMVH